MIKYLALGLVLLVSCQKNGNKDAMNQIAEDYVKLALEIGQYDADFVDAYYGPDSLKPKNKPLDIFPKDQFLTETARILGQLEQIESAEEIEQNRVIFLKAQLKAFDRRIRIYSGEKVSFDQETLDLFGVKAPVYDITHFENILDNLEQVLPGKGDLRERYAALSAKFVVPKDKIDTLFKASLAECQRRTKEHFELPAEEVFTLEYVGDKAWSGYNWYKGNFTSLIQINTDFPISIERVIDVGSHESYPGHHVYNMLLEKNLYLEKGFVEMSLYPLFSPQSLIAEGSANYGIELAFPGEEKTEFARKVLLPLAGLDTTGIAAYFKATEAVAQLNYAGNEAARAYLNGIFSSQEAIEYLGKYGLYSKEKAEQRLKFIEKYRSYVINYNYGKGLIKRYVESSKMNKWEAFGELLSRQVDASGLGD